MSDIFISYAGNDREKAKLLSGVLEQKGWSVWWDRDIPPGKPFDRIIEEALDAAKCIIVLWSKESVKSDWVKDEAEEGKQRNILVPVLIDDIKMPLGFRRIQAAHLFDWDGISQHAKLELLVKSISSLLGEAEVQIKKIQEDLIWQKTEKVNSIESYRIFLSKYPDGKYKTYALQKMQGLEKIEKEKFEEQKIKKSFKTETKSNSTKQQISRRTTFPYSVRFILRSFIAIVVGYLTIAIPIMILFLIWFGFPDPENLPTPSMGFMLGSIVFGFVFTIAGGYMAALIANRLEMKHAYGLAGVVVLLSIWSMIAGVGNEPFWLQLVNLIVGIAGVLLGGAIRTGQAAKVFT